MVQKVAVFKIIIKTVLAVQTDLDKAAKGTPRGPFSGLLFDRNSFVVIVFPPIPALTNILGYPPPRATFDSGMFLSTRRQRLENHLNCTE